LRCIDKRYTNYNAIKSQSQVGGQGGYGASVGGD